MVAKQFFICAFILPFIQANSIEKFENLQKFGNPFLETFWESYLSFPYLYDPLTCAYDHLIPGPVDETAFGYDLAQLPSEVKVVNIAFAAFERTT